MLDLARVRQAIRDVSHTVNEAELSEADEHILFVAIGLLDEIADDED